MFYKIKDIKPLKDFVLEVTFENEKIKYYDVSKLFLKWPSFCMLKEVVGLFNLVKVDAGGYGVYWNDEIDLSCSELWENGYEK